MKKRRLIALAVLMVLMLASSIPTSYAVCTHTKAYITYKNRRVCAIGCGFAGIYKQDVWDEETTYRCINGLNEVYTRYDVRNGTCC